MHVLFLQGYMSKFGFVVFNIFFMKYSAKPQRKEYVQHLVVDL